MEIVSSEVAWLCVKVKCNEHMKILRNYFNFILVKCNLKLSRSESILKLVFQYVIKFSILFSNKEYLWVVSRERIAGWQESFKDKGRIRGLWLSMHKCWFLENSTTICVYRGFSHRKIASKLSCFVSFLIWTKVME